MSQDYYLLNHLDDPMRFLFFTIDEFLAIGVPLFVGICVNEMIWGAIIGLGLYQILKFIKRTFKGASLRQLAYWFLPTNKKTLKILVPSNLREFLG
jgi:type IV conjugative transfer system protein TraL